MDKLEKPLYHGTTNAASIMIIGNGFNAPIHLTESEQSAFHYAKAATAYLEHLAKEEGLQPIADGWAVFTFLSLPNKNLLIPDDYNPPLEPNQWVYGKPIKGLQHFTVRRGKLEVTQEEHLRLQCFAIGMWRK